ncbi:MAG: FAD:protein FMN transferase [bacterium]
MKYIVISLALSFFLFSCSKEKENEYIETHKVVRQTYSMGSVVEIQIINKDTLRAIAAIDKAFLELARISDKYSTFISNNYMSEMNNAGSEFKVDAETYYMLKQCDFAYEATNHTFDAALGSLIKLVGFEEGKPKMPTQKQIDSVITSTGWKHIDLSSSLLLKRTAPVKINFGGIGDGYSLDKAAAVIKSFGIDTFLINAGGEVRANGKTWNIGIQHPRKRGQFLGVLQLENKSVSTSGDYEKFFQKSGKRFSHIIDPRTGQPCDNSQAVTIIADKGIRADALATGIFVLGPIDGMKAISKLKNVECLIVDKNGKVTMSPGFEKYFKKVK